MAKFDSSAALFRANANFLKGRDFPALQAIPFFFKILSDKVYFLPYKALAKIYVWGGWKEGSKPRDMGEIDGRKIDSWIVSHYPRRKYPAIAIGSSNGALTHLWTALNIPWLPQTYLIPVRRLGQMDNPKMDLESGKKPADIFLADNPDLEVNQMYDPSHDRLMLRRIAYFRIKKLLLGEIYKQFIIDCLEENGTIFIANCSKTRKVTKVSERHYYQFGGLNGTSEEEYLHGSKRVEEFLKKYQSPNSRWDVPEPDAEHPESEWGYETGLTEDIIKLAKERNYKIKEVEFADPEDVSPFVSDLYSHWNELRGIAEKRLFIESFIIIEPWWTVATGSIPYWMKFNMGPSLDRARNFIKDRQFEEIYTTLFSNGIESIGFEPIEKWRELFQFAKIKGDFIGMNEAKFPADFAVFIKYYTDLQKKITARYPIPEALTMDQLENFITRSSGNYSIKWKNLA